MGNVGGEGPERGSNGGPMEGGDDGDSVEA